ncbi:Hypothetical predicted protein [Pelobates cultripes]|uniref:Uncharacterized protein n=1 Tax=Pelobates cultripes TaxID=61616 RepID=A0AAD1R871_PELCU|nr:Hypothetical predicted protein [Pelobates cultripes]
METLQTQSPLQFETLSLTALQDLCHLTLEWHQIYMPITKLHWAANIPYRWGIAHSISATKEGNTYRLTTMDNSAIFLQSLGMSSPNRGTTKTWDISAITLFVPLSVTDTG